MRMIILLLSAGIAFGVGLLQMAAPLPVRAEEEVGGHVGSDSRPRAARPTVSLPPGADPRGEPELIVCSQNLKNFGSLKESQDRERGLTKEGYAEKLAAIVARLDIAKCDVVAAQEVLGRTAEIGRAGLETLATALRHRTGRVFEVRVGDSNDGNTRIGFLVAADRAEIKSSTTYRKLVLPKLSPDQKPRLFARAPLEMQISVRGRGDAPSRSVSLVAIHFKSKSGGGGDPAGLEWETYRMEMAEGVRRIVESRFKESLASADQPLIVLGDRNSNFDVASAKILEGSLSLSHFQGEAVCRLSKRGVPVCKGGVERQQELFSVLTGDPQVRLLPGTFVYKKTFSWLDDILLPAPSLPLAWQRYDTPGDFAAGILSEPADASDHSLVWVALNW